MPPCPHAHRVFFGSFQVDANLKPEESHLLDVGWVPATFSMFLPRRGRHSFVEARPFEARITDYRLEVGVHERYAPEKTNSTPIDDRRHSDRPTTSWRMDRDYIRVKGKWVYFVFLFCTYTGLSNPAGATIGPSFVSALAKDDPRRSGLSAFSPGLLGGGDHHRAPRRHQTRRARRLSNGTIVRLKGRGDSRETICRHRPSCSTLN